MVARKTGCPKLVAGDVGLRPKLVISVFQLRLVKNLRVTQVPFGFTSF